MDLILKNVEKKDLAVLKSLSKSLGFEIEKEEKSCNPEFVNEILEAEQSSKEGQGIKIKLEDLWKQSSGKAQKDILYRKKSGNKAILNKITALIEGIMLHPFDAIGKPEPLKYNLSGLGQEELIMSTE